MLKRLRPLMSLPVLSILAFAVAIVLSSVTSINVGLLSIAFAFAIGVWFGGMRVADVAAGFPSSLFLVLLGVTFLFSQAGENGTLDRVARRSIRLARGNAGWIPLIFFALAVALSASGAGNIAGTALLAPMAMAVAGRVGISAFLMTVMVATGASAGGLSPFAPTGVIANGLLARQGLTGVAWPTFFNNLVAQSSVAVAGYFLLGGAGLLRRPRATDVDGLEERPFEWRHKLTLLLITALIASVVLFQVDVGMGAFVAGAILTLARAADESACIKRIPWNTIVMVCGVTVLISILEKTGGMDLFTALLARFSTQNTITGVIAFVTGVISVYSSSSGVVLPAFLPTIPGLIRNLGGGDPLAIASSINVGAHLVDVSPLSTLGALCIACAPPHEDRNRLFTRLLLWGLSMSVVGAVVCYVFFGLLGV
jgi:di/tricarboxylate transporter